MLNSGVVVRTRLRQALPPVPSLMQQSVHYVVDLLVVMSAFEDEFRHAFVHVLHANTSNNECPKGDVIDCLPLWGINVSPAHG